MKRSAWRELLGQLAETPAEKQRIASELGVREYSVTRWINGETLPRRYYLRRLPELFPTHRSRFEKLLLKEFPDLFPSLAEESEEEAAIPGTFYERYLWSLVNLDEKVASWTILQMGLDQLFHRIDKENTGARILILRLTPSESGVCRSLHKLAGLSKQTTGQQDSLALFGSNSLVGQAVSSGQVQLSDDNLEIAVPLKRYGAVAGCLLFAYSRPLTSFYQQLIKAYANIFALQFREGDFSQKEQIQLQEFPSIEQQQAILESWLPTPTSASNLIGTPPVEAFQRIEALLLQKEENDVPRE